MSRRHNDGVPTLYEVACLAVTAQAGGEFVDVPTIRLRLARGGIETNESTVHVIMERFCKRGYAFRTDQNRTQRGESFVFYTLTAEGLIALDKWSTQLKALL
jgi:hypothetical protein